MTIIEVLSTTQSYYAAIILIVGFLISLIALLGKIIFDSVAEDATERSLIFLGLSFIFQQLKKLIFVIALVLSSLQLVILYVNLDTTLVATFLVRIIDLISLFILYRSWYFIAGESERLRSRMGYFEKHKEYEEEYLKNEREKQYSKNERFLKNYFPLQFASFIFLLCIGVHIYTNILSEIDILWVGINTFVYLYVLVIAASLAGISIPKHRMMIYTIDKNKPPIEAYFIRWEREGLRVVTKKSEALVFKSQIKRIEYP